MDVNTKDVNGLTPLHWACIKGSYVAFQYLMPSGVDVNAVDSVGRIPLHYAVETSIA